MRRRHQPDERGGKTDIADVRAARIERERERRLRYEKAKAKREAIRVVRDKKIEQAKVRKEE